MAPPFVEGAIVSGSRLSQIMWERFSRAPDPRLVFDGVKDMIDGYHEWDKVVLYFISLAGFDNTPGWLTDNRSIVAWFLPRGNCSFGFSNSGPYFRGRLEKADVFLHPDKEIPHLGDVVLHQMFIEAVGDL